MDEPGNAGKPAESPGTATATIPADDQLEAAISEEASWASSRGR
jgi:hypothetical protein